MFSSFYINSSSKSGTSSQKIELTRKSFSLLTHPALRLKILHSYRLGAKLHYANAMKVISMHFGTHFIRRYTKLYGVKLNKVVLSLKPSSAHQALTVYISILVKLKFMGIQKQALFGVLHS